MSKFYCVFLCLCFCLNSFGQEKLFTNSDAEIPLLTHSHNHQIALFLNLSHFNFIKNSNPCEFQIQLPFFEGDTINLYLESFDVFTNDFQLLRNTENGLVFDDYKPIIKSYRIKDSEGWTGSISFMKNYLIGVVKKSGKVYEIKYYQDGVYILYDVNASISESNFICQTDTDDFVLPNNIAQPLLLSGGRECLEMGIEIDNYTYNEFNGNCYEAVEWSLALLAGVNEVYIQEDGQWNLTTEIDSNTPFVFVVSVKDNWKIDNVVMTVNKGGSGFMTETPMSKLESDNSFNISKGHRYYYYFEQGLDAEAYTFTFTAEDEEGNNAIRKTSVSIV